MALVSFVILCIVLTGLVSSYEIPTPPTVEILQPRGFRVSIPDEPGIQHVAIHGNINVPTRGQEEGDFYKDMRKISGRWVYENKQKLVTPSDVLYYWMSATHNKVRYIALDGSVRFDGAPTLPAPAAQPPSVPTPAPPRPVTSVKPPIRCMPSKTIVKGRQVCQGELLFEDDFTTLDLTKWKKDIRIPSLYDDADFVSFQNRPENCYVNDGRLYIVPNLLTEVPGFSNRQIRTGKLDLAAECTAVNDIENECKRNAGLYRILPPIISARINTKDSFSFQYGRVEIRAKLPRGDWVFPQIFLEPLAKSYGVQGYASGHIRVAFIRGNEFLQTGDDSQISGSKLFGGVVLSTETDLRDTWMKNIVEPTHFGSQYHTYSMTWSDESISFAVDGETYAHLPGGFKNAYNTHNITHAQIWENGGHMAPFDKEFFIALGVSAGGVGDFPDNCRTGMDARLKPWSNKDPKGELRFWQNRNNWYPTWGGVKAGLQVDYIKVWAL